MKVLFAVNNENISESIIKKYQQEYKEIISAKNVYYFNAIIKELQRDKTYDRIIISEDLQPFSNNNYDTIDKFIFDKLDNISDEATNESGNDIPIILICTDRRTKSEPLLVKLFGIGIYNALLEKDRSITNVCELLNRPRTKKEAKVYYRIDSDDVDYKVENEGDVTEEEIQNILNYYKKIGGNEQKYVESFDHIASQYTDAQLRLIAKFLPLNVKAVLEANSLKYQEAISFGAVKAPEKTDNTYNNYAKNNTKVEKPKKETNKEPKKEPVKLDLIENNLSKNRITEPVVIPSAINTANIKKMGQSAQTMQQVQPVQQTQPVQPINLPQQPVQSTEELDDILEQIPTQPIIENEPEENMAVLEETETVQPKRRGRPRKVQVPTEEVPKVKKGRGRPRKVQVEDMTAEEPKTETINNVSSTQTPTTPVNLFELGEEDTQPSQVVAPQNDMILPGLDDESLFLDENSVAEATNTLGNQSTNITSNSSQPPLPFQNDTGLLQNNITPSYQMPETRSLENTEKYKLSNVDLSGLLTKDKKVVAFVGTSKNGTSFLVNNLAEMISQKGINTAILDLTQNRNAYYIYTENEEDLRKKAYGCIENLRRGNVQGIQVNKNLTVYTTVPGENNDINDYANILQTLIQNYSLILLDCDFETNYGYFKESQELYLVQSLDVLTIQPLTAFLRNLKARNVLNPEKIRIVLNKVVKLRSITDRTIIGGMAFYNDPAMSFMTELFNKDTVPYCSIPFEEQTYSKYLEGLVNCKITLNGYSKNFMAALTQLAGMVYPLIGGGRNNFNYNYNNYQANNRFSSNMNDTLNKMKNSY